ncbi:fungal-specific transcription factor domain-containing protein [Fusarium oxysporum Fo47]|uniref:fungal-specific transcription factor domain-containing protein n=1 Tax=Fusarium oxysporum Fo47 TaxID=660027 RepID=UPI002869DFCD|nr:fungal-specific transcription factor domain-containing protein [Fusarium oxysporum Fo47]QKD53804.2 fungal-specific transcription factor domain-domain-containing protein [Fusarium oxysporum Fo47]
MSFQDSNQAFDDVFSNFPAATDLSIPYEPEPRRKRRKVQLACDCCRARKVRCDGKRPVCDVCRRRGSEQECLYEEGTLKTQKYVLCMSRAPVVSASEPEATDTDEAESTDGLATVSLPNKDQHLLYGPSSTIAFVEHVLLITGETEALDQPAADTAEHRGAKRYRTDAKEQCKDLAVLDLSFWDIVHPVYPILHIPTFMRFYNRLWEPGDVEDGSEATENPIMLATLNMVLAIGCRFTHSPKTGNRAALADQFYQRARRLVPIDTLDEATLPVVQLLLLNALHLQSTMHSNRCWNMVGLATRVAQSLGLHTDARKSSSTSQLEREMRRRVWYVCVTLDRLICTTFGRPSMLPCRSRVPLPITIDDEYLLEIGEGTQPPGSPCRLGLFVYTIRLLEILDEVLKSFYAQDAHEQVMDIDTQEKMPLLDLDEILRLNSQLDVFLDGLPDYLTLQGTSTGSGVQQDNTLLQPRILYCRCSAWWSVYFTFGAATVLQASILFNPDDEVKIAVDHSLSLAMEILTSLASEVKSSTEAIRVVQNLKGRLQRIEHAGSSVPTKRICDVQALTEPLSRSFLSGNFDMGPIMDPFFDDCAIQQTLNSIDWGAIFESQD